MKHKNDQNAEPEVPAAKKRPAFRPYIKNTVSLTCGLYKNDEEAGPITQHELSTSFRVRLIPVLLALAVATVAVLLMSRKKKR